MVSFDKNNYDVKHVVIIVTLIVAVTKMFISEIDYKMVK